MLRNFLKPKRIFWEGLAGLFIISFGVLLAGASSWPTKPTAPVNTLSFSPNGQYLVVAHSSQGSVSEGGSGGQGGFQVLEVKTKSVYGSLPYEKPLNPEIYAGAYYSSDGKFIVVSGTGRDDGDGSGAGSTVVYDASNFEPKSIKPPKEAGGYMGDMDQKVSWGTGSFAKITKVKSKATVFIKTPNYSRSIATKGDLAQLKLDRLQHLLAITDSSGEISIVDLKTGHIIGHFSCLVQDKEERAGTYYDSNWFPQQKQQKLLLTTNGNNRFVFWDAARHKVIADVTPSAEVTCSALSPDGNSLALGYEDGRVQILTAAELGNLVFKGSAHM